MMARPYELNLTSRPIRIAKILSAVLLLLGVALGYLGVRLAAGLIPQAWWGFPMSPIPNLGKPWGLVLLVVGAAYIIFPILLLARPLKGWVPMMVMSGLSVLLGTPVIQSATEMIYNGLRAGDFQRPEWADSVWAYYMMLHIAILVALYKFSAPIDAAAHPADDEPGGRPSGKRPARA